ncbi:MAG: tetratricopeptide repeat protein [Elusimicrobia bacterium]|nr:tetratricopeptide repeat protein [Elusimicrobiota bacterium]
MLRALALCLALLPARAGDGDQLLTLPEYRRGLKELRGYFEKRGEDPRIAERYVADLEAAFPVNLGERVPVTREVFQAFLKYQAAWARKTRDGKNPHVAPGQHRHEVDRAVNLKAEFKAMAEAKSPQFYRAFQAAVRDVRGLRLHGGKTYAGASSVFFSDQVDDSYTHVDAGNEALEKGDDAKAIEEANQALAQNPANADALVLRAGAQYDRGNASEAVADAQSALVLDPGNQQAQAILGLLASAPASARSALAGAADGGRGLAGEGRAKNLPRLGDAIDGTFGQDAARAVAPSATPAVGKILSEDLSALAVGEAKTDPRGSMKRLDQAMALDPQNDGARGWFATIANRAGEYGAARTSAERGLAKDPNDALAYYNKAYALAGAGDKQGMVDALQQAARIDPSYRQASAQALNLSSNEAMEILFGAGEQQHQPPVPRPHHRRDFTLMLMLGAIGGFLVVGGASLFFRKNTGPRVVRL